MKPAWLRARPVLQWDEIPGTAMSASPALFDWGGSAPGMQKGIVNAWGAMTLTPDLIGLNQGGAHGDYGGNEIMGIDFKLDVLSWFRACDPTPLSQMVQYVDGGYPNYTRWNEDGKPQAAHVYWSAQYLGGRILRPHYFSNFGKTISGRLSFAPNNEPWLNGWNVTTRQWDTPGTHPTLPNWRVSNINEGGGIGAGPCGCDGNHYYAVLINALEGAYYLHRYGIGDAAFQKVGSPLATPVVASGTYPGTITDKIRRKLVQIGEKTDKWVRGFNLDTGECTYMTRSGVDFGTGWDSSYSGNAHDTKRDKYYVYSGQATTDKNLYVINPDTAETSIMTGIGTPSITTIAEGINDRMKYIEPYDCLIIQPSFFENLLCLRLS